MIRRFIALAIFLCLLLPNPSSAQIEVGAGVSLGFPMAFNKYVGSYHHSLGSPGAKLHLSYLPPNGTITPTLALEAAIARLPVSPVGNTGYTISMVFARYTANLYGRFKKELNNATLYYGIGIGASKYYHYALESSIRGDENISITSIQADTVNFQDPLVPNISLNLEYKRKISQSSPTYLSIGGQLHYQYFFDKSTVYRIDVTDSRYQRYRLEPKLFGHVFDPMLYIMISYQLGGKRGRY